MERQATQLIINFLGTYCSPCPHTRGNMSSALPHSPRQSSSISTQPMFTISFAGGGDIDTQLRLVDGSKILSESAKTHLPMEIIVSSSRNQNSVGAKNFCAPQFERLSTLPKASQQHPCPGALFPHSSHPRGGGYSSISTLLHFLIKMASYRLLQEQLNRDWYSPIPANSG